MSIFRFIIFILAFLNTASLLQKCEDKSQCLENSNCVNSWCRCNKGYVLDCSLSAPLLQDFESQFLLYTNFTYFSIFPAFQDLLYLELTICQQQQQKSHIQFNIWVDNGKTATISEVSFSHLSQIHECNRGCSTYMSTIYRVGRQINGERDILILGIKTVDIVSLKVSIKIKEREIVVFEMLLKAIMMLFVTLLFTCATLVGYCIFQRHRRVVIQPSSIPTDNFITHFDQFMPKFRYSASKSDEQVCAVCFGQFEEDFVRRTYCDHLFHTQCIDSWCSRSLNCPVCRSKLDIQAIEQNHLAKALALSLSKTQSKGLTELVHLPNLLQIKQLHEKMLNE